MTSVVEVLGVGAGVAAFLALGSYSFYKLCMKALSPSGYTDHLLNHDSVGALNGLSRGDIPDRESDASKWLCNVCAFANGRETLACALCETKRGTSVAANTSVTASDSDHGLAFVLHPSEFSPLQHSAVMRKEWRRVLDAATNSMTWVRTTIAPPELEAPAERYFVVTSTLPFDMTDDALYPANFLNEFVQVVVEEGAVATHSEYNDLPETTTTTLNLDMAANNSVCIELGFHPIEDVEHASRTLMGTRVSPWLTQQLVDLADQPFTAKYVALLSLLKANIDHGHVKFRVYRHHLYDESMHMLQSLQPNVLCTRTRIELLGEAGIDAGGLQREWYTLFTQAVFEPSAGLFVATDSYGYTLNPSSTCRSDLEKFRAVGRLLARSILDEQVLPFHLTVPLFKMILGTPLSMTDMLYMDKQMYTSLKFVQSTLDVDGLCLDFSVTVEGGNVVELVPHGQNIMVTAANQAEYVQRMLQYLLFDRIQLQLQSLLTGLFEILPQYYLIMFDHKELELVLCGVTEIDVADWKQFTVTSSVLRDFEYHSMKMYWFWDILENMASPDRAKILQFATGSTRVPVQGILCICRFQRPHGQRRCTVPVFDQGDSVRTWRPPIGPFVLQPH
ncbi:hypothetical protein, variant 1 [Aphanomyces astaci]|uniref:HECT-type E3 ubiquitin transferase n=1 Tax=Aphanomyces astaci TaxID=112090 RepID=W4FEE8_APHAT|nr:hypothetical protein, variant 1 [Aphanomyces astaci]ETV65264.1 hypothetical protein, variant 1 [Aphanomyces astaci]|eukprot:XP_009845265.1 hypothetical protein, variant 1 [Aphanomyces astaci]